MSQLTQGLGLVLAAMVLGWTILFSFVVSPQAFKTLDTGRAKRMIRETMKTGHPLVAMAAAGAAVLALLAGAVGGAVVMGCSAALFLLAAYTLAPREDNAHIVGGKRKADTARVVAAMLTVMITCVVIAGVVLIGMKI